MRIFLFAALLTPIPAAAQDFSCRNAEAEISCDRDACEINAEGGGFTPMGLSRQGNTLSICAYAGCAEGPTLVRRTRGGISLLYAEVRPSSGTGVGSAAGEPLAIIYDHAARTAQMRWRDYANVMRCE